MVADAGRFSLRAAHDQGSGLLICELGNHLTPLQISLHSTYVGSPGIVCCLFIFYRSASACSHRLGISASD